MELNERIICAMQKNGVNQAELARLSNIEQSQMHYIVSGKTKNPRVDMVLAIADALGVDYNYIFGYEESGEKCGENSEA